MKKINEFKTRIMQDNKVYLLASDAVSVLGYDNIKAFTDKHAELIKDIDGFPSLISENDLNFLLLKNPAALKKIRHLEFTKVDTLRSSTENIKGLAPLKILFAKSLLEYKMLSGGYSNVEECLEAELDKETKEEKEKIEKRLNRIESIKKDEEEMEKLIDRDILKKYGLVIQNYTSIKNGHVCVENFIAGKGIFFAIFNSDYAYDLLKVQRNGDLVIPTYDETSDSFNDKNFGHDTEMRDFRNYSCLENIVYIIKNRYLNDAGVDLLECDIPGINFFISQTETIKLLSPNQYREIMLLEGQPDFESEIYKTKEA